ncbi:hypothetical protein [Streptoalloteichus hindustanus]|uniref:Uncharacterized protein n=1 Tax=Streptoalloteichus hindustanus TaxID=2017 RepID=A0A1M5GJU3_STRHI|nr:hypothetical protein [Streptoalloteichus hindustanus]SHG03963.1 hypothetical protein SAMN05444320_106150 [Streptoalloteichus hindustanus]
MRRPLSLVLGTALGTALSTVLLSTVPGVVRGPLTPLGAFAGPVTASADDPAGDQERQVAEVRTATARYADVQEALNNGYAPSRGCVESPEGGMGVHYVNPDLVGRLDLHAPDVVLYEPLPDGSRRLVAVEWLKWDEDQDASTDDDRPSLLGVPFDGPFPADDAMPARYELHAWVWDANPNGMFARWNPNITCANYTGDD